MFEKIKDCSNCSLCNNQKPLLEECSECKIFWVGLSAKMHTFPLSASTNTGKVITGISSNISSYRTNIVKCVPLDKKGKLRYPNKDEIDLCFPNFTEEITTLNPQIVFLFGNKVTDAVSRNYKILFDKWSNFDYSYKEYKGIYFVPVHHPSHIYIYKRNQIDDYKKSLLNMSEKLIVLDN